MEQKELVKSTYEYRFHKIRLIFDILVFAFAIFLGTTFACGAEGSYYIALSILLFAIDIALGTFDIVKLHSLLSAAGAYEILDATATDAHIALGRGKGRMYLELEITTSSGNKIHKSSKGVYTRSPISPVYYRNFINAHFRVLYDRTSSTVLIINE